MFENYRKWETEYCGKPLTIETGKLAELANGSCLVRFGETVVLCTATMSEKPRPGIDFFPLSVDFEEKLYAVGRIPGSFMKREGRPSERAVLASRMVDRPLRPFFPASMRNDVAIVMTVLSVEPDFSPEIAGMLGAAIALSISDIPWQGPIAGIEIGLIDGKPVMNPTADEREKSQMKVTLSSSKDKVIMIEAGGNEVPEDQMIAAIAAGHEAMQPIIQFIEGIQKEIGKEKIVFEEVKPSDELFNDVKEFAIDQVKYAMETTDKNIRDERMKEINVAVHEKFEEVYPEEVDKLDECIYKLQKYVVRRWLLDENKRVDGRGMDEIRPLAAEVASVPRVHGSGMFTRGQTQVLSITTLGTLREAQILDGIYPEEEKRYMHQYNFPSYSVGETRPNRGPGRREIGHGALAEKALVPVLPSIEDFPYAIRVVSEVLSSNGSTSQGSICASSLSLMDAGVPIKKPVAGISCGLITEDDRWMTMVDIQGIEDFFGDMDFKVGGTHDGITAIQVDIKNDGLTMEIIEEAIRKCQKARFYILDEIMAPILSAPRKELSPYAPKMVSYKIHPDKIREVIGSGGKVIQKICADFDVKVDIEDDGSIFIAGMDQEKLDGALNTIKGIVLDPEVGANYKGTITRILAFGAFAEIAPGKEGLIHISRLANERVEKVEDVVKVGDSVEVRVIEIDDQHRINLSMSNVEDKPRPPRTPRPNPTGSAPSGGPTPDYPFKSAPRNTAPVKPVESKENKE